MSQDRRAQFNAQISAEAAAWLVEFRWGEIDATGRCDFATWIWTSPESLRAYLEMAALWNQGGSLTAHLRARPDITVQESTTEIRVIRGD